MGHSCFDKLSTNGLSEQHWVGRDCVRICLLNNGLLNESPKYHFKQNKIKKKVKGKVTPQLSVGNDSLRIGMDYPGKPS